MCAACLKPSSRLPASCAAPGLVLPPWNTTVASLAIDCASVATCCRTSYVTFTRRAASIACSSVSAATAATGSPWYRTSLVGVVPGSCQTRAAFTPGARRASLRSTAVMRACGCGERTILPKIMPGRLISKLYLARPDTLSGPSRRLTRVLRTAGFSGHAYFFAFAVGPGGAGGGAPGCCALATSHPLHVGRCFHDSSKCPAAADVAVETRLDLRRRRVRVFFDERDGGHHETWRAEAAHQRVAIAERLLHRVERRAVGEAVHRAYLLALDLDRQS